VAVPALRPCEPWSDQASCDLDPAPAGELVERAITVATELLWALSGRRFGICTATVRPCRKACAVDVFGPWEWWGSWPWVGSWPEAWALSPHCRRCGSSCGCSQLEELKLPRRPVTAVSEVTVDGEILPEEAYRVDDFRWLVRLDGGKWPSCQDMQADVTEAETFSVTFSYGRPVPESGVWAAERLACELLKAMVGDDDCQLPERVQTVSRRGVTVGFLDPMDFIDKGRVGITDVDLFLRAFNPHGLARRARIYRADTPASHRRTGT